MYKAFKHLIAATLLAAASLLPVTALAGDTLQRIIDFRTLKVGMSGNQPPMTMTNRQGGLMGFDVDLAQALAAANKRVGNILAKRQSAEPLPAVDESLLQEAEEQTLASAVALHQSDAHMDYPARLQSLAALREPVDAFFDKVMVNVDDEALRNNRLALLDQLHQLFLDIADIAELQ